MAERPPPIVIASVDEARALERTVRASAEAAREALAALLRERGAVDAFRAMKFGEAGFDPFDPRRRRNLLEQVHQTVAHLTALRGAEHLLRRHPEHAPYRLNLGTSSTPDLESADGAVVAEVVAVHTPAGNGKVASDLARLRASPARHRYLFCHAAEDAPIEDAEVEIVSVTL
jgi:hypothetical protein